MECRKTLNHTRKKVIWIHQPELSNVQWWSRYSLMLTSVHVNSFTETKGRTGVSALCAWYIGNLYNLASSNYSSILLRTAGNLFLTQIVITCPHQTFGLISLIGVSSMASLTTLLCCYEKSSRKKFKCLRTLLDIISLLHGKLCKWFSNGVLQYLIYFQHLTYFQHSTIICHNIFHDGNMLKDVASCD